LTFKNSLEANMSNSNFKGEIDFSNAKSMQTQLRPQVFFIIIINASTTRVSSFKTKINFKKDNLMLV